MDEPTELREDPFEAIVGVILPVLLLILAISNVATGTAWTIAARGNRSFIQMIDHPGAVAGFVSLKVALAAGLFAWFWMANRSKYDRYTVFVQMAAAGIGACGLLLIAFAFFF